MPPDEADDPAGDVADAAESAIGADRTLPPRARRALQAARRVAALRDTLRGARSGSGLRGRSEYLASGSAAAAWDIEHFVDLSELCAALDARELAIDRALREGEYDFVLCHLPIPTTHGHHQAATILALRAVKRMDRASRPVLFGATTNALMQFTELPDYLEARAVEGPVHVFDRTQPFGHRDKLDYRVVVNWVIAAHKSQGTMQLAMSKGERERYFVLDTGTEGAHEKAAAWFEALKEPQFPKKVYGASAGTNASSN